MTRKKSGRNITFMMKINNGSSNVRGEKREIKNYERSGIFFFMNQAHT